MNLIGNKVGKRYVPTHVVSGEPVWLSFGLMSKASDMRWAWINKWNIQDMLHGGRVIALKTYDTQAFRG